MPYRLDTETQVFCYVDEFYCLSNFSPFRLLWRGQDFDTSERAYQWEKFFDRSDEKRREIREALLHARSAHDAFQLARTHHDAVRREWPSIHLDTMKTILEAKVYQHAYVARKLRETGTREIIEDSWRDAYWGWGPHKDGKNMLGKLWMQIRDQISKGQP